MIRFDPSSGCGTTVTGRGDAYFSFGLRSTSLARSRGGTWGTCDFGPLRVDRCISFISHARGRSAACGASSCRSASCTVASCSLAIGWHPSGVVVAPWPRGLWQLPPWWRSGGHNGGGGGGPHGGCGDGSGGAPRWRGGGNHGGRGRQAQQWHQALGCLAVCKGLVGCQMSSPATLESMLAKRPSNGTKHSAIWRACRWLIDCRMSSLILLPSVLV